MILKNKIKKIIDVISDTEITEIEISSFWGAQKIKLKKGKDFDSNLSSHVSKPLIADEHVPEVQAPRAIESSESEQEKNDFKQEEPEGTFIRAPLVGTFYLSPKPGEPPFVENDKKVNAGEILCIIEAMKIFNDIESENNCIIKEILVNDGEPVEYDQPLFLIEEI